MSYAEFFSVVNPLIGSRDEERSVLTVFGVPFDGTTSYRPGTRFGPNAIREAFLNIEAYSKVLNVDVEKLKIRDIGNLLRVSGPDETSRMVTKVTKELVQSGQRYCMLGGEHSITLGSFRNAPKNTALVVFDAHFDLRDEWEGSKLSHACYLRRINEERDPAIVAHVGGRAATEEEWRLSRKFGLTIGPLDADTQGSLGRFKNFLSKFKRVYVSIDIDGLDPAFAPGTGTPEPGGLSTLTLLKYLYALKRTEIIAFDIVEVSPPYDNGSTSTAAARFMNELAGLTYLQSRKD